HGDLIAELLAPGAHLPEPARGGLVPGLAQHALDHVLHVAGARRRAVLVGALEEEGDDARELVGEAPVLGSALGERLADRVRDLLLAERGEGPVSLADRSDAAHPSRA